LAPELCPVFGEKQCVVISLPEEVRSQASIDQFSREFGSGVAWVRGRESGERRESPVVVQAFSQALELDWWHDLPVRRRVASGKVVLAAASA
jgi:hypothetical protein